MQLPNWFVINDILLPLGPTNLLTPHDHTQDSNTADHWESPRSRKKLKKTYFFHEFTATVTIKPETNLAVGKDSRRFLWGWTGTHTQREERQPKRPSKQRGGINTVHQVHNIIISSSMTTWLGLLKENTRNRNYVRTMDAKLRRMSHHQLWF